MFVNLYNVDQHAKRASLPVIFLMGQTASGKTELSIALSQYFPIEIISVDSALIYRGMDIGTAKPTLDQLLLVPHHLINICDPQDYYSVMHFCDDAHYAIKRIVSSGCIPLLVGGSMFYFKALFNGLSVLPERNDKIRKFIQDEAEVLGWKVLYERLQHLDSVSASKIHYNDHKRLLRALEIFYIKNKTLTELAQESFHNNQLQIDYQVYLFALVISDRFLLHKRIEDRFYCMLDMGFEDEVRNLISSFNLNESMPAMSCIGYRQMYLYLFQHIKYDDMIRKSISATCRLAKHQMTWLRGWKNIFWLEHNQGMSNHIECVSKILNLS